MKLFIWNWCSHATERYHSEGGIVAIAEDLEAARKAILAYRDELDRAVPNDCEALKNDPDLIRECEGPVYVAIHPDAGCC